MVSIEMHHPGMQLTFKFRKDCFVFVSEYYQDHYIDHATNSHADHRLFFFNFRNETVKYLLYWHIKLRPL